MEAVPAHPEEEEAPIKEKLGKPKTARGKKTIATPAVSDVAQDSTEKPVGESKKKSSSKPQSAATAKVKKSEVKSVTPVATPKTVQSPKKRKTDAISLDDSDNDDMESSLEPVQSSRKTASEGQARKKKKKEPVAASEDLKGIIYISHIPHGFYEQEMKAYFSQFGDIKNLYLSRNKSTGMSRHWAYMQFVEPAVAPIAAKAMNNYLMFDKTLKVVVTEEVSDKFVWPARPFLPPGDRRAYHYEQQAARRNDSTLTESQRLARKEKKNAKRAQRLQRLEQELGYTLESGESETKRSETSASVAKPEKKKEKTVAVKKKTAATTEVKEQAAVKKTAGGKSTRTRAK